MNCKPSGTSSETSTKGVWISGSSNWWIQGCRLLFERSNPHIEGSRPFSTVLSAKSKSNPKNRDVPEKSVGTFLKLFISLASRRSMATRRRDSIIPIPDPARHSLSLKVIVLPRPAPGYSQVYGKTVHYRRSALRLERQGRGEKKDHHRRDKKDTGVTPRRGA